MKLTHDFADLMEPLTKKDASSQPLQPHNQTQSHSTNNQNENRAVILSKIFGLISWAYEKNKR
jgi:hypothetical protein